MISVGVCDRCYKKVDSKPGLHYADSAGRFCYCEQCLDETRLGDKAGLKFGKFQWLEDVVTIANQHFYLGKGVAKWVTRNINEASEFRRWCEMPYNIHGQWEPDLVVGAEGQLDIFVFDGTHFDLRHHFGGSINSEYHPLHPEAIRVRVVCPGTKYNRTFRLGFHADQGFWTTTQQPELEGVQGPTTFIVNGGTHQAQVTHTEGNSIYIGSGLISGFRFTVNLPPNNSQDNEH